MRKTSKVGTLDCIQKEVMGTKKIRGMAIGKEGYKREGFLV